MEGIHSRTDFDLKSHQELSKKKQQYFDPEINENYIPYVVETSVDHREPASTYSSKVREHFGIDSGKTFGSETVDSTLRNRSTYFGNDP
jgi:hypothetical protein